MNPGTLDRAVVGWHLELYEREMGEHEWLCESPTCADLGRGDHPADWLARSPCGCVDQVCEERRLMCRRQAGWWCRPRGCGELHPYPQIGWMRIRRAA